MGEGGSYLWVPAETYYLQLRDSVLYFNPGGGGGGVLYPCLVIWVPPRV